MLVMAALHDGKHGLMVWQRTNSCQVTGRVARTIHYARGVLFKSSSEYNVSIATIAVDLSLSDPPRRTFVGKHYLYHEGQRFDDIGYVLRTFWPDRPQIICTRVLCTAATA